MRRKIFAGDYNNNGNDDDVTNGGKLIMLKSRAEGNYLLF